MQYCVKDLATCYDRGGEIYVINVQYIAGREDNESSVSFHTLLSIWFTEQCTQAHRLIEAEDITQAQHKKCTKYIILYLNEMTCTPFAPRNILSVLAICMWLC